MFVWWVHKQAVLISIKFKLTRRKPEWLPYISTCENVFYQRHRMLHITPCVLSGNLGSLLPSHVGGRWAPRASYLKHPRHLSKGQIYVKNIMVISNFAFCLVGLSMWIVTNDKGRYNWPSTECQQSVSSLHINYLALSSASLVSKNIV